MGRLYGALLILSLIWGTSFLFIKFLVEPLGAWGVVFWRCIFGLMILLLVVTVRKEWRAINKLPYKMIFLVSLLNNAIPWALIALSETKISSSFASLLNATTPIWTVIIGYICFSSKLKNTQWIGVAIGFLGIIILTNFSILNLFQQSFIGLFTMIFATICYGFSTHLSRNYLRGVSITMISTSTLAVSAVISFLFAIIYNPEAFQNFVELDVILSLVGLGIFGSGIAYLLYYYMIQKGSAEFASLVTYLVPITALIWGYLFLREEITLSMILGFCFIIFGVYLTSKKPRQSKIRSKAIA
ncbi:DMT family transporter [Bacillus salitolerans]|uniref:DMT family transporter n=1 Tax=Bacillus salitolerans TaxID=1437434 RepID=A0ABW4LLP6_9BACI